MSQLQVTKADFERLLRSCHAFPRFHEYVTGFGRKSNETEVGPPPLKCRDLFTTHENTYRGFGKFAQPTSSKSECSCLRIAECTYILRYIEFTNRGGFKDPWSLRQFGVYHRFKSGVERCSTWILVGASQRTERRLDQYTRSVDDVITANPFELHVIFLDTVINGWRPYLVDMTKEVSKLVSRAGC